MAIGWMFVAGLLALDGAHLRTTPPSLQALLREAVERSDTIRSRVARLDASDLVVYLDYDYLPRPGVAGFVTFITASGGWRFVRISLRFHMSKSAQLVMLGHELQHAVEIADAPEVIDQSSLAAFYTRIGTDRGTGRRHAFDTRAAVEAEDRVDRELRGTPARRAALAIELSNRGTP
jgi:hypothetical protein